jgi:putative two-component system response regulator
MSLPNRRVLLVDDHADFLESVRELLAAEFEVHVARSGAEALARCQSHGPFAAVVSDFGMPGMTGIQLFAELRREWPETPRLLLTGCGDLALAREALEEGAIFRFLAKPPVPAHLVASVAAAVEHCQRLDEERELTAHLQFTCEALGDLNRALDARLARERLARRERGRETKRALLAAMQRLARNRDDETGEHLERVAALARYLARAARADGLHAVTITDEYIDDLGHAAPLHDVGKVAIPDAILFKPGKLDPGEWDVMRTHAAIGAEILRGLVPAGAADDMLTLAHEIAWTHHERWDGTGYPRGLAGEQIPLAGRIMALVDCYDALTSERPYKRAWTHAAAIAWLAEQRGLAFDPALTDSLLAREGELAELLASVHSDAAGA